MKPRRYHGLKRPKLRQSWNKYNLYNIAMMREPRIGLGEETFFQQKWRAKGMLRTYHGEHIVERKWERMFSRRLLSAVEMDTHYMAANDGSELAAGRGSGKDVKPSNAERVEQRPITPYMQMVFAPMERRLDIAVFRAMFASSARQARQFCVHGAVKVNGKVIPYPAYRLNPGDMFQVDPERVLYATGLPKVAPRESRRSPRAESDEAVEEPPEEAEAESAAEDESGVQAEQDPDTTDAPEPTPVDMSPTQQQIKNLAAEAKAILKEQPLSVSQKRGLRDFIKKAKPLLARSGRPNASATEIIDELAVLTAGVNIGGAADKAASGEAADSDPIASLTESELVELEKRMEEHIRDEEENPHDPSKPYGTPWRPRNYMAPFAFIPRYLEVNQNICAAVYLRHPVARKGSAEVPTPYGNKIGQLAFNWYLRRR